MRKITRYKNRKLYCHQEHRYVTNQDIAYWVTNGVDVLIIDNQTRNDITAYVLSLVVTDRAHRGMINNAELSRLIKEASNASTN